jgi:hypothetical protein
LTRFVYKYETTLKVDIIVRIYSRSSIVHSRCLHEAALKVGVFFRVYKPKPPSKLVLLDETALNIESVDLYTYEVRLVNSRPMHESTQE